VKKLQAPVRAEASYFGSIIANAQRIANLLSVHRLSLKSGDAQMICFLKVGDRGGVQIAFASAVDEAP
jgi:hypothetical protein